MSRMTRKRAASSEDEESTVDDNDDYKRNLSSPFSQPNLTLIIEKEKLFVRKEDLMAESPVFSRMFSSGFKEADNNEVELPGKNLTHFLHFLRCVLPGFQEQLNSSIVHDVLPLAHEYQTEKLLKKIEIYLANMIRTNGHYIKSDKLIDYILEAEKYNLQKYLDECINVASRKQYESFVKKTQFSNITANTQLKISLKRWRDIDALINNSSSKYMYEDRNSSKGTECMRERNSYNGIGFMRDSKKGEKCMGNVLMERFTQNT